MQQGMLLTILWPAGDQDSEGQHTAENTHDAMFLNQGGMQGNACKEARPYLLRHEPAMLQPLTVPWLISSPRALQGGDRRAPALSFSGGQVHGCRAVGPECRSLLRIVLLTAVAVQRQALLHHTRQKVQWSEGTYFFIFYFFFTKRSTRQLLYQHLFCGMLT